jgi:hypothetical protein
VVSKTSASTARIVPPDDLAENLHHDERAHPRIIQHRASRIAEAQAADHDVEGCIW